MRRNGKIRVFVFGNALIEEDRAAKDVAKALEGKLAGVEFVFCSSYDEMVLEAGGEEHLLIMDVAEGIKEPKILAVKDLQSSSPYSAHDLDLGFFLKLMKPKGVKILGIPKAAGKPSAKTVEKARRLLLGLL